MPKVDNERLAAFPKLNPNPVLELTLDGDVGYINDSGRKRFPDLERLGKAHPLLANWKTLVKNIKQSPAGRLARLVALNGTTYHLDLLFAPQGDSIRIYALDITERERVREDLEASEKKYRELFENLIDGLALHKIIVDKSGKPVDYIFLEVNKAFEEMTGLKATNVVGKRATEIVPGIENDPADWIGTYGKVALTGEKIKFEQYSEGLGRWYSVSVYSQEPLHFTTVFEDITGRRKGESALAEAKRVLEDHIKNSPLAIVEFDADFHIVRWSDEAEHVFGWRAEEVIGKRMTDFRWIYEDDTVAVENESQNLLTAATPRSLNVNRNYRKDGSVIWCEWYDSATYEADGKLISILSQVLDVTTRKQADDFMAAQLRMLTDVATTAATVDEMIQTILDECEAATESNIAFYHFVEADQETLYLQTWSTNTILNICTAEGKGSHYPVSDAGVWADAVRLGRPVIHNDYASLPDRKGMPKGHAPVTRELVVPIVRNNQIVAIVGVGNKPADYNDSDRKILEHLASLSWEMINRKRVEEALKEAHDELEEQVEQRTAELAESEARLRVAAEQLPAAIFTLNRQLEFTYISGSLLGLLGITPADRLGRPISNGPVISEGKLAQAHDVFKSVLAGKSAAYENENAGMRQATYIRPLTDAQGVTTGIAGVTLDVTERRKADDLIKRAGAYNRSLIEASLDPLVTIGPDGRITDVNSATLRITGVKRDKLIGSDFFDYFTEPEKARAGYLEAFEKGSVRDYPLELKHKNGKVTSVLYNASVYRDESGDVTGVFAAARDITERKKAEDEVRLLNVDLAKRVAERTTDLEAINKELQAFAYSVSHDLRAPLRTLDGFSQALIEDYGDKLDATGLDYLNRVRVGSQTMAKLIDDLLVLSRMTRQEMKRVPVSLTALATHIVAELRRQTPGRIVKVKISPKLTAEGDKALITVALQNLIGNAWKFTSHSAEPIIEVGSQKKNGETVIYVRDNGVGFDMKYSDKLFAPFQRLHQATEFPGTGIGLATVQRVINRHGGRVWATSEPGAGATFYFTLQPKKESK